MKNKNILLITLIVVLSLCVVSLSVFVIYNKVLKKNNDDIVDNEKDNNINNDVDEENNNVQKILYIVKDENNSEKKRLTDDYDSIENKGDILGEYKCTNKCYAEYPYIPSPAYKFIGESSVLITVYENDEMSIIKYNYVTKQIEDTYDYAGISYDLKDGNYSILVGYVEDSYNRKGGLLSKDGNMLTDFEYDSLPSYKMTYYGVDSKYSNWFGPNSLARVGKDDLYGVIDVSNGKVVVELKYQDIILSPNGYYSIKENNKWYLFNTDMKKVLNEGYDGIFGFDFGILVLNEIGENKLSVKLIDYNGEDLTKSIEINNSQFSNYNNEDLDFNGIHYFIQDETFKFSKVASVGYDGLTLNYDKDNKTLSVIES